MRLTLLIWTLHDLAPCVCVDARSVSDQMVTRADGGAPPPGWHDERMSTSIPTVDVDGVPDPLPQNLTVLDVREDDEWDTGHLEGARHIRLRELPGRVDELPSDQPILVYCKSGGRSAQATAYLQNAGLSAANLDGGVDAWARAGRALV